MTPFSKALRRTVPILLAASIGRGQAPAATVFGQVHTPHGEPAVAARVVAWMQAPTGVPGSLQECVPRTLEAIGEAATDERGRFVLALPRPVAVAVTAALHDWRSEAVHPVAPGASVELHLAAEQILRGTLETRVGGGPRPALAAEHAASRGVALHFERPPRDATGFAPNPDKPVPALLPPWSMTTTGAGGTFTIAAPVPAGATPIVAACAELGLRSSDPASLVGRFRQLAGTVCTNANGGRAPVAGAVLRWVGGPQGWIAETGADGGFGFDATGDPYLLVAARGFQPEMFLASQHELVLERGARHTAVILDGNGRPLAATPCWIVHWTQGPVASGPVAVRAVTDEAGALEWFGAYPVTVHAHLSDGLRRAFHWVDGMLEPERPTLHDRSLRGSVRGPDRAPLAHAPIWLARRDAPRAEYVHDAGEPVAYADHGGRFVVEGLADGPYWVATASPGQPPTTAEVDVGAGDVAIELAVARGAQVSGRVVDGDGNPVPGALVGIHVDSDDPAVRAFGFRERFVWTDRAGRFSLACLGDRAQSLTARAAGARDPAAHATVEPGTVDVELVVRR